MDEDFSFESRLKKIETALMQAGEEEKYRLLQQWYQALTIEHTLEDADNKRLLRRIQSLSNLMADWKFPTQRTISLVNLQMDLGRVTKKFKTSNVDKKPLE